MGFKLIDIDPFATGNILGPKDANRDGTPDAGGFQQVSPGGNLANTGGRHAGEYVPPASSNGTVTGAVTGDAGGAPALTLEGGTTSAGGGYWGDYGNQAADTAQQQGQQYQDALNQTALASTQAGQASADALNQTGGQAAQAGQQYAGALGGIGQGAQNYALGSAGAVDVAGHNLGTAGGSLISQARDAQGRDISGAQQSGLIGIEQTAGPSAAQGQLNQATSQNMAQALAMARSGRGWGGSAGAMQQAAAQRVGAQQTAANQSAVLTAQEDAARRQRMAQNFGAAGQLATQQAGVNDAQQNALNQAGLGAIQSGGNLQLGAGQLGLGGYGQNVGAQQAAAGTTLSGLGQQAQAQQAGGALNLQGYGQAANTYGNAAAYGQNNLTLQGNIEQQGLGWQQQNTQNQLQAAGINNGLAIQQQNQGNQMMGAYMSAAGSVLPMLATLSDRNTKEGIKPTNVTLEAGSADNIVTPKPGTAQMLGPDGYVDAGNGKIQGYTNATNPDGSTYALRSGDAQEPLYDPYSQGTGISGPNQGMYESSDPYSQGTGISGPNQMDASKSAQEARAGAQSRSDPGKNGSPNPGAIDKDKLGGVGKGGNLWQTFGGAMQAGAKGAMGDTSVNPVTGQPWMQTSYQPMQTYQAPMMGAMQPITSDKREKEALDAIEESPGYSFNYKDPDAMGATDGRQFGIMAQDLEKTPAGRSVVHEVGGKKMVDTSRLTMVNTAAMNALTERLAKLEAAVGGKRKAA